MSALAVQVPEYGEVFTRRWVVDVILDLVGYTADRDLTTMTIVEPSAGSGAFLVAIIERLLAARRRLQVEHTALGRAVFSFDLQAGHVADCRRQVVALLTADGCDEVTAFRLARTWVEHADFLLAGLDFGADFVVGNPPYIRMDDIDPRMVAQYRAWWPTMAGRCDIYVPFIERSLTLLKPGGRLGFICADRWMRNAYGAKLRAFVAGDFAVKSVWQMHDVDAFHEGVSAYPAITVIAAEEQGPVAVLDTTADFGPKEAAASTAFALGADASDSGNGWVGARLDSWFSGSDFWPSGDPSTLRLLEHLSERFPSLDDTGQTRISIGVATGADKAYVVGPDAPVEADRLLPLVMAQDVRSGRMEKPGRMLANPWDDQGRLVRLADYPLLAKHLACNPAVRKRFVARRNPDSWHRTIDKVYPGLIDRPKLLFQDMKAQITPVFEPGGYYPHHNLYYIVSDEWDLEVLGGLLLSRIAEAFISAYCVKMRGGTLRFQAQYLRKIRVPAPGSLPGATARKLKTAFREYDRDAATRAAEAAYGLPIGMI